MRLRVTKKSVMIQARHSPGFRACLLVNSANQPMSLELKNALSKWKSEGNENVVIASWLKSWPAWRKAMMDRRLALFVKNEPCPPVWSDSCGKTHNGAYFGRGARVL